MFGIHDFWLFLVAVIALVLTPGQDTMFIVGRSLSGGSRCGLAAAAGVCVGSMVHTLAAAFGLSVLLATSAAAFAVVKFAGALYLIYLGAKLLLSRLPASGLATVAGARSVRPSQAFLQGILTNVLNPKVALFFLAFLPQFIDAAHPSKVAAFLLLGATFITLGTAWSVVLALGAARLQGFFMRRPGARVALDRTVGGLFVALGVRLAWARPS